MTAKPSTPPRVEPKSHQVWEHTELEGRHFPMHVGADGWELVCVVESANGVRTFYFKRPKL
jgi:hypothetical protein